MNGTLRSPPSPRVRAARKTVLGGLVFGFAVVALGACGSRTGLFVAEDGETPDGIAPPEAGIDDAAIDGPLPCVPGRFPFERATSQLMFVLDRSGSMLFTLDGNPEPGPGQTTRWNVLRDALAATIVPFDQHIAMGAKFYPRPLSPSEARNSTLACSTADGTGIAPRLGNASSILEVFDATTPRGGTPTAEALRLAAESLIQRRAGARTIVLATDGAPNCNTSLSTSWCRCTLPPSQCDGSIVPSNCLDDVRTVKTVRDIFEKQKVPVYVIGIGSDRNDFVRVLDDMAVAGGRPREGDSRHYSAETPAELTEALSTIRDSVAACTYLTPSVPTDPDAISVEIGGVSIPRDPTHRNGWDWTDQDYGSIAFFGSACDEMREGSVASGVVRCE